VIKESHIWSNATCASFAPDFDGAPCILSVLIRVDEFESDHEAEHPLAAIALTKSCYVSEIFSKAEQFKFPA